jgi:hypothetical protein
MATPKPLTRKSRLLLGLLQLFIAISGIAGGFGLVLEPSGANIGITTVQLARSPFQDYLVPGLTLLFVIGVGNLIASASSFLRYRYTGELGVFFGGFLAFWIIVQVVWLGLVSWLQPFYFLLGCGELLLGWRIRKSQPPQTPNDNNGQNLP